MEASAELKDHKERVNRRRGRKEAQSERLDWVVQKRAVRREWPEENGQKRTARRERSGENGQKRSEPSTGAPLLRATTREAPFGPFEGTTLLSTFLQKNVCFLIENKEREEKN